MHTCPLQRLALVLLMLVALASLVGLASLVMAAAAAWGVDFTAGIAAAALGISALLVAAARRLHEAWREARWNAGHRLS